MSLREVIPTSFADLLNLFGISLQGNKDNSFVLSGDVVPVVLVGSTAEIQSISTPITMDVPFTAGYAISALNAIVADTGPQLAGLYALRVITGGRTTTGTQASFEIERRDAANAANIWSQSICLVETGQNVVDLPLTVRLQVNERVRVRASVAATLGTTTNIWLERLGD